MASEQVMQLERNKVEIFLKLQYAMESHASWEDGNFKQLYAGMMSKMELTQ